MDRRVTHVLDINHGKPEHGIEVSFHKIVDNNWNLLLSKNEA